MQNFNNRRHERFAVNPSVLQNRNFTLVDLSESGAKLYCDGTYRKGAKINLSLNLDGQEIDICGETRWCLQSHSIFSAGYNIGVQFMHMSVATQVLIRKYIAKQVELKLINTDQEKSA